MCLDISAVYELAKKVQDSRIVLCKMVEAE